MAIILAIDMTAVEKRRLLLFIDTSRDITERMRVRIDEAMARRYGRRRDLHPPQSQGRAAGVRLIHALI